MSKRKRYSDYEKKVSGRGSGEGIKNLQGFMERNY